MRPIILCLLVIFALIIIIIALISIADKRWSDDATQIPSISQTRKGIDNQITAISERCQQGWKYFNKTNACYLFEIREGTFLKAIEKCEKMQSSLVSIHSSAENKFISGTVS